LGLNYREPRSRSGHYAHERSCRKIAASGSGRKRRFWAGPLTSQTAACLAVFVSWRRDLPAAFGELAPGHDTALARPALVPLRFFQLSADNGHAIIADRVAALEEQDDLAGHLERLRELPFVRDIELKREAKVGRYAPDALLTIRTPRRRFRLALETKQTFLDHAHANAFIAEHLALQRKHGLPLLLAARYVPRPMGERLAEAGVNFVDRVGNIHLKLGDECEIFLLGRREAAVAVGRRRPGSGLIQLLFALLAEPRSVGWPIRKLAEAAGIGKTMAAIGRQYLAQRGVIRLASDGGHQVIDHKKLRDDFLVGYQQVLRPRLLLGSFRPPERDTDLVLQKIAATANRNRLPWAVTGGPAAYVLEKFYRGDELPLLIARITPEVRRELRLVPDASGPVVFLRAFSRFCAWRTVGGLVVAHPWLIYAELLHKSEPRAIEAAEQISEKYLSE